MPKFTEGNKFANLGYKYTWPQITELFAKRVGKEKDEKYKAWLLKQGEKSKGYTFFNAETYYYCYQVHKKINFHDNDHCTVITGKEGSGKTTVGFQLGGTVSDTFVMKNVIYEPQEFFEALDNAKKGDSILVDEGVLFLFARESNSSGNKDVVKLFMLIRQKNLHLILIIPEFKAIEPYIRKHRVDTLFNVYTKGYFDAYDDHAIKIINEVYPKTRSILKAVRVPLEHQWDSRFAKDFPNMNDISREQYVAIKKKNLNDVIGRLRAKFKVKGGEQDSTPPTESKKTLERVDYND